MSDINKTQEAEAVKGDHAQHVRSMFAGIASRYDLLNHLLSGNTDKRWRRLVASKVHHALREPTAYVLDVACGTGDLGITLAAQARGAHVIGIDFCRPMLEIAQRKAATGESRIPLIEGDALQLPFADRSFDASMIAFGLRNLTSVEQGLQELLRVLKPRGSVAILEFSHPVIPGFRSLFRLYFNHLLPRIGGVVSGSQTAYEYLPRSVRHFPDQQRLVALMRQAGFERVEYQNLTGGIAAIHTGMRPPFVELI